MVLSFILGDSSLVFFGSVGFIENQGSLIRPHAPHLFISVFRVRNGSVVAAGARVSSVSLFLFPELPQRDFVIAALQQKRGAAKRKRNHVQFFD